MEFPAFSAVEHGLILSNDVLFEVLLIFSDIGDQNRRIFINNFI